VLVWRKTKFANKLFWRSEFWIIFIASLFILHFVIFFSKTRFLKIKWFILICVRKLNLLLCLREKVYLLLPHCNIICDTCITPHFVECLVDGFFLFKKICQLKNCFKINFCSYAGSPSIFKSIGSFFWLFKFLNKY